MNEQYTKITLDFDGNITEFECNFDRKLYTIEDLAGKNWVDTFIEDKNKEEVRKYIQLAKNFTVDIHCKKNLFKLVSFEVEIKNKPKSIKMAMNHTEPTKQIILNGIENLFRTNYQDFYFIHQ